MAVKKRKLKPIIAPVVAPVISKPIMPIKNPLVGKSQPSGNIWPKKPDYSLQGNSLSNNWGTLSGVRKKKKLI